MKQVILKRVCDIRNVKELNSEACLNIARRLFGDDYAQLRSSRTFEAWWKDTLINPFVTSEYLWSYLEILPILEQYGCEFYSSSPMWATTDRFQWYKALVPKEQRQKDLLTEWGTLLPYFLTGIPSVGSLLIPSNELISSFTTWLEQLTNYVHNLPDASTYKTLFTIPVTLEQFLGQSLEPQIRSFGKELGNIFQALGDNDAHRIVNMYRSSNLRSLWGTAYHYLCAMKTHST